MMFKIFADDLCFYNDRSPEDDLKLISPRLKLSDNSAGSLTFTLPPCNVAYSVIKHLSTYIYVYRDEEEIWSGRVIDEKKDFWNNRTLTCEGRLAFLNDTTQPKWKYSAVPGTLRGLLEHYITVHNDDLNDGLAVNTKKRFTVGTVSATLQNKWSLLIGGEPDDSELICTDYEKTFECIRSKIVDQLGGHFQITKSGNDYVIDYMDDLETPNTSAQSIEFGNNLSDFTRDYDMTSLVTVIIPLGARLEDSDDRLTIDEGSVCADNEVIAEYGHIEKVVEWGDVKDKAMLKRLATKYLESTQFDNMVLEIKAVDLHYLNPEIDSLNLLDTVTCISKPHGLNKELLLTSMDIPLDDPASTVYTLGKSERRTLSDVSASSSSSTQTKINNMSSWVLDYANTILSSARANAASLMDARSKGYITFTLDSDGCPEEIYIADNKNYLNANRYWRWNVNGLAYYNRNTMSTPKTAWTMDGGFCADFITSGTIAAARIEAFDISASHIVGDILTSRNGYTFFDLDNAFIRTTNGGNMGAEMSSGRFRMLWNTNEIGGLGTQGDGEPRLFCHENKTLHIGFGHDGSNEGDAITVTKSKIAFLVNVNGSMIEQGYFDQNGFHGSGLDSRYAAISHSHSEYASSNHTHSGYASSSHSHSYSDISGNPTCDTFFIGNGYRYINYVGDGIEIRTNYSSSDKIWFSFDGYSSSYFARNGLHTYEDVNISDKSVKNAIGRILMWINDASHPALRIPGYDEWTSNISSYSS